jgi:hypothetical protein
VAVDPAESVVNCSRVEFFFNKKKKGEEERGEEKRTMEKQTRIEIRERG